MKVKRILFINSESVYPFACTGASESMHLLLQQLQKIGAVCMAVGCMQDYYLRHHKFDHIENRIQECLKPYRCKNYVLYDMFWNCIQKEIKEFNPDLIITQSPSNIDVLKVANMLQIPVVLFIHSFDEKFSNKQIFESITMYKNQYYKIFAVSEYVKNCLDRYSVNSLLLYPGFRFENYDFGIENADKILFVNPCVEKGINYIIKLAKEFVEEEFIIRENWAVTEKRVLNVLTQFDNIKILPYTDKKQELFTNIKLLLFPSICKEAFGRVVVEACYLGIKVIANNVGGVSEALQEGELIEIPYDIESWKECMRKHLNEKWDVEGGNIKQYIRERFDISIIAREFLDKSNLYLDNE